MLCLHPQDIDGDITFLAFALRCVNLILADYPFVVDSVIGNDHEADCVSIIEAHRNSGGQFIFVEADKHLVQFRIL